MSRLPRAFALPLAALLGLSLASPTLPASGRSSDPVLKVAAGTTLTLTGHGYGHGRGMSQYGAEGAARQGLAYDRILAFYYPGTALASAGGTIAVRIGADTTPDTQVAARSGLVARVVGRAGQQWSLQRLRPSAVRWRLRALSGGRTSLAMKAKGKPWKRVKTLTGVVEFAAGTNPVRLYYPGRSALYRGALRNAPAGGGDRDTVNVLPLESYLRGVVAREMPSSWSPAALRAQAVAARTFAAYTRAHAVSGRHYQICDSTSCQVYGGVASETAVTDAAIAATAGRVLTFRGQPAFTQFGSSSGGWTVAGTLPYQAAKADPYDAWAGNRVHDWTLALTPAAVAKAWPAVGTLTGVQVVERDGNGDWGGRVLTLRLTGTKGSVTVPGTDVRTRLGLRSTWFTLAVAQPAARR